MLQFHTRGLVWAVAMVGILWLVGWRWLWGRVPCILDHHQAQLGQHRVAEVALQLSGGSAHEPAVGALHGLQHGRGFGESQARQVAPARPVLQGALNCGFCQALVRELGGQGARHSLLEEHVEDWGGLF
jgi:hypothetical protein